MAVDNAMIPKLPRYLDPSVGAVVPITHHDKQSPCLFLVPVIKALDRWAVVLTANVVFITG